ncbi:NAD(P)/FAD-dependent oxidoreductase [Zavarzinella formosa]|uniref:NAD(P)/FAD-dependent oxidoreductase n=1 Tax=Zavarzinella formosa TaxID=360055 RepID=UPI000308E246|nr:FAD-dependent oxidoreductase [Zavarzinella formosa]
MALRVSNLRLSVDVGENALPDLISRTLGIPPGDLHDWRILRKSLDVRDKRDLRFVYNAEVRLPEDAQSRVLKRAAYAAAKIEAFDEPPFEMPTPGSVALTHRPVVIGSGPAGLVAGYFLAEMGYQPLVLERGSPVHERIRDVKTFDDGGAFHPESNYLFGEGGAGTFSDGKLTCRNTGPDVMRVLKLFADCKGQQPGKPSIMYFHRPHLGSNRLPAVVKAIRQRIESLGGEVRFKTRVEDLVFQEGRLKAVVTSGGEIPAELAVIATGHSARDMYEMLLRRGVPVVQKPFQIGVRVEHPQELVNRVQYGFRPYEETLGNADYSLVAHGGSADVFTFCMCAGGYVIPSVSQEGYFATNGMSLSKRDSPYANSGLVVTLPLSEFGSNDPLAGMRIQEQYERKAFELGRGSYACPVQRATDFMNWTASPSVPASSYPREKMAIDLAEVLPPYIWKALQSGLPRMDGMWRGKFMRDAVLVGPESRGSSPVRIPRDDETRETPGLTGIYPAGEGAGYAGGIVSAAVDGLRTAKAIVARYASLRK